MTDCGVVAAGFDYVLIADEMIVISIDY